MNNGDLKVGKVGEPKRGWSDLSEGVRETRETREQKVSKTGTRKRVEGQGFIRGDETTKVNSV